MTQRQLPSRVALSLGALTLFLLGVSPHGGRAAAAQEMPRPMTAVDLIEMPSLSDPRLSPDGESVVYVLSRADWKENRRISHLWLQSRGGTAVQLTYGEKGESSPRWSPSGDTIAFLAERGEDEDPQIYLLPTQGGEARRLSDHDTAVSRISWSADGEAIYFLASDPESKEEKQRKERKDDVFPYDEDYEQRHLWRIEVANGKGTRITEGAYSILGYDFSRDGKRLVLHRAPTPLFDDSDESEVWVAEADGSDARQLTANGIREGGASLSPDGSTVLFVAGANEDFETYYNDKLFLVPAAGGEHRVLLPGLTHEIGSAEWSADGEAIYFTANTGIRSQLFRLELASGDVAPLTEGDHAVRGWHYRPARDQHLVSIDAPNNAGDAWSVKAGDAPEQRTHVFDDLASRYRLPRQEAVSWRGADGAQVEGLLFYPLDYEEGARYPLVVQTHGGPASSDKFGFGRWSTYVPLLTARGWMVFKPNYRGSTGYGDDFLRDMVGHYFRQAHLDVMTGVDALIERGLVDGERMVKMGWSAGGHMTNKIITHTERFKAASSGAGAVNWISMYGQSDVRIYRTPWFGGTPWQEDAPIDVYWGHSPLKDIYKVTTPTLVLVGENDVRVPMPQSVELYRALRTNGVPTKLYVAPREGHGWRELRHELFKINVELDWFERWALGREYEWERAPGDGDEEAEEEGETENATAGGGDLEPGV